MSPRATIAGVILLAVLFIAYLSMFTVKEGQGAMTLRLGELTKNPQTGKVNVFSPGIHFKLPIISNVRWFDMRLQTMDVAASRILTAEQKYVLVDYYAKWRIADLALYYKRTGGYPYRAEQLLKQKINNALRAAFGKRSIKDVISGERSNIMDLLQQQASESAQTLGIKVTDVRLQAIDLPTEVRESVYQRMRSQREQVAAKHRSQGRAKAEATRANADAKVAVTVATARSEAQKIRAAGDNTAANIYAAAYSKDAKFYSMYRSLQAYKQVFNKKNTVMVLKMRGKFFKYFANPSANTSGNSGN